MIDACKFTFRLGFDLYTSWILLSLWEWKCSSRKSFLGYKCSVARIPTTNDVPCNTRSSRESHHYGSLAEVQELASNRDEETTADQPAKAMQVCHFRPDSNKLQTKHQHALYFQMGCWRRHWMRSTFVTAQQGHHMLCKDAGKCTAEGR